MIYKSIKYYLFIAYAVILLGVLYKMIYDQQNIFNAGTEYKFKCIPVDPNDPFRGKFVRLSFAPINIQYDFHIPKRNSYYGIVEVDQNGFAFINKIDTVYSDSLTLIDLSPTITNDTSIIFNLPFDRLYMNENKAKQAEDLYRQKLVDGKESVYANVFIADGRFLLDDVYVGTTKLRDLIQ